MEPVTSQTRAIFTPWRSDKFLKFSLRVVYTKMTGYKKDNLHQTAYTNNPVAIYCLPTIVTLTP